MSEHLPDVELTPEQEARFESVFCAVVGYGGEKAAARLIIHLQDRVAELEGSLKVVSESHQWLFQEKRRLEAALRGISSCGTCEACRGAALLAIPSTTETTGDGAK